MAENVSPPGAEHEAFTTWAKAQGVRITGIEPTRISGRGLGIAARRRIEVLERLLFLPQLMG